MIRGKGQSGKHGTLLVDAMSRVVLVSIEDAKLTFSKENKIFGIRKLAATLSLYIVSVTVTRKIFEYL